MYSVNSERCVGCGMCAEACPQGAIQVIERRARIDPVRCVGCGVCARVCPREAILPIAPPPKAAYRRRRTSAPLVSLQLKELKAQTEILEQEWEQVMERFRRLEGKSK